MVGTLGCAGSAPAPVEPSKPNVLFIAVDDLNDWVGCLKGHPQALTPNIDRLAERGVLFTNAHTAAPACNPSRAAVFSGRMPTGTGVWSNTSGRLPAAAPHVKLLPRPFEEAGYATLGTGKLLHPGGEQPFAEYYGVEQRWSPFTRESVAYTEEEHPSKGTKDPRHVLQDSLGRRVILPLNRMPSDRNPHTRGGESFDWGPFDVPDTDFGDTQITDWAIARLRAGFDAPFFMGVGYYRPHIPLWAPKRYFDRFAESPGALPPVKADDLADVSDVARQWAREPVTAGSHATVIEHDQWQPAVEAYLASVTYVDFEIGRLVDALDASAARDSTVIVLWSDHGWHLGEKEHWGKWTGWERSTRVPLVIVPSANRSEGVAVGSRSDEPVGLIDLYPTLLEMAGVEGPGELDGRSLVPLLHAPGQKTDRAILTLFDPGNASLRTDRWRLIQYDDGSEELYDLQADPHEWDNLAGREEHAAELESLRARLSTFPIR